MDFFEALFGDFVAPFIQDFDDLAVPSIELQRPLLSDRKRCELKEKSIGLAESGVGKSGV